MAFGLGLIFFTAFPLGIPLIALTVVFAAPVIVVGVVAGAVLTPPVVLLAWLTRRLWLGLVREAYAAVAVPTPPLTLSAADPGPGLTNGSSTERVDGR